MQFIYICVHRFVNAMVTTQVMTAADVNLAIMEKIVANHRSSLDRQLPLTLMMSGRSSLRFFECYLLMTPAMLSF